MARPANNDFPSFFIGYIIKVEESDLREAFGKHLGEIKAQLYAISEEHSLYSYAPGKWSIREVVQHLIDAERVFGYRAVSIARGEEAALLPFDENAYAACSDANRRTWQSLLDEFFQLHHSTQQLFNSFTDDMLARRGISGSNAITVLSIGYIVIGHILHHLDVLKTRYLTQDKFPAEL